jgi:ABC-type transport system involved in multi-copper enzyme maturation permease subunit
MLDQLLGIFRNTFFESIRQPIALVVLAITTLALILANPLSAFTMESDQRMLIDMGLATVFLCGGLLASFIATGVLTREIENKTALTVVSKPVGRPMFVIGKFLGVAAAMLLCTGFMSLVFLLVEQHAVLETVRDPIHVPVIAFGSMAVVIGVGVAVWCNYFYGMNFTSMTICTTAPLLLVAFVLSLIFNPDFSVRQQFGRSFEPDLIKAIVVMTMAVMVLVAVALAASARLGQIMTLVVTLGVFLLGLLSDWIFGRRIEGIRAIWLERAVARGLTEEQELYREFTLRTGEIQRSPMPEFIEVPTVPLTQMAEGAERLLMGLWQFIYGMVPNFQVLWLSDALTQERLIPMSYVWGSLVYGATYVVAALALAVFLFQRREVG